ncbi:MAG: ArsR/SmtB family transcription factor [Solirubrobacterales bacterium]
MSDKCELLCLNLEVAEDLRQRAKAAEHHAAAARLHSALGDELRLAMLASLAESELCGCDLAWIHERSQSLISHHMKLLVGTELVVPRREGKVVFFSLTALGEAQISAVDEEARI